MLKKWRKMILMKINMNLRLRMKIRKPISWAHKAKHRKDSALIIQDLCIEIDTTSTGDNILIIHQIVIDHDQIQDHKTYQRTQSIFPRTQINTQQTQQTFTCCVGCRCTNCVQIKADTKSVKEDVKEVKKMLEKLS